MSKDDDLFKWKTVKQSTRQVQTELVNSPYDRYKTLHFYERVSHLPVKKLSARIEDQHYRLIQTGWVFLVISNNGAMMCAKSGMSVIFADQSIVRLLSLMTELSGCIFLTLCSEQVSSSFPFDML